MGVGVKGGCGGRHMAAIGAVLKTFEGSRLIGVIRAGEKGREEEKLKMGDEYRNSGIVSANRRKRPGKKDPDISGTLDNVVCPHCNQAASYWLSGWLKEGAKGKFYGLSVKPKDSARAVTGEHVDHDIEESFS